MIAASPFAPQTRFLSQADLQQGAYTSLGSIWVLWWSTVFGFLLQELSARVGVVTGKSLSEMAVELYTDRQSSILYFMIECAIIGSDTQEVLGSAIAIYTLSNGAIPLVWGCLVSSPHPTDIPLPPLLASLSFPSPVGRLLPSAHLPRLRP